MWIFFSGWCWGFCRPVKNEIHLYCFHRNKEDDCWSESVTTSFSMLLVWSLQVCFFNTMPQSSQNWTFQNIHPEIRATSHTLQPSVGCYIYTYTHIYLTMYTKCDAFCLKSKAWLMQHDTPSTAANLKNISEKEKNKGAAMTQATCGPQPDFTIS